MTARRFWLGTSWKMTKTLAEARAYADQVRAASLPASVQLFVLPAATALAATAARLGEDSPVLLGAQNAYPGPEGAVTGEVSMGMVRDAGARMVEIGHAERRTLLAEDDDLVAAKVAAAAAAGLVPLLCVGETAAERDRGEAAAVVAGQVRSALRELPAGAAVDDLLVAYEPHWAIGAGGRTATPEEIAPAIAAVRAEVAATESAPAAGVLYGGSVDADHVELLLTRLDLDGLFVGRSAWTATGLLDLAHRCAAVLAAGEPVLPSAPAHVRKDR